MPREEETFVERLGDIPVLNDGWTSAVDCYSKLREMNSVTRFTLGIAETGVKKAAEISSPVMEQYKSKIDCVNSFACNKLDQIESKYPLIKQPSEEVKDACLEYVQPVVDRVKPMVSCVQNVVSTGKNQVNNIKATSTKLVTGACELGKGTVTGAVTLTLSTPPGRLLTRSVDGALNIADDLMDKYIPEVEQENDKGSDEEYEDAHNDPDPLEGPDGDLAEIPQMEVMEPSPERVVVHLRSVSGKLRKRMFQRAMRDYQGAKTRTVDALGKLNNHINLIDYAKTHFGNAKDKVGDVWGKIVEEESLDNKENEGSQAGMLEENIISLGRVLMHQVRSGVQTMEMVAQSAGQFVRHPVSKSKEYKELVLQFSSTHSLSDISKTTLDSIRANINAVRKNLLEMVEKFDAPSWLAINLEVDDFGLEEDDDAINASVRAPPAPVVFANHVHG